MIRIFRLPLIPILIAYTLGITLGNFNLPFSPLEGLLLFILLGIWTGLLLLNGKYPAIPALQGGVKGYNNKEIPCRKALPFRAESFTRVRTGSWITLTVFFLIGLFSIQLYLQSPLSPSHISRFNGRNKVILEGIIDRPPEHSLGRTQLLIRSERIFLPKRAVSVHGPLLIFLKEECPSLHVGDRIRFLCRLYAPRGFHNPGGFSYEHHLALERIHTVGFPLQEKGIIKLGEGFKNPFRIRLEKVRDHLRDFLEREAHPESSGILKALVLGEQGSIPPEVKEQFIVTGIAHLLAISGDHLGIVALLSFSLVIWVLKRSTFLLLTLDIKKWAAAITLPCLLLYSFVAGGGISIIRATLMVIIFFLSILFDRGRNLLHTLALAAFLILAFSPPSLFDISFQLSFMAVLSILYLMPHLLQSLKPDNDILSPNIFLKKRALKYLTFSFVTTCIAILGTAPLVALYFNRFSLIGFFTNLLMIPWVGFLIVPFSLIASLVSFFSYPLATLILHGVDGVTLPLLKVIAFLASIPYASFFISTPTWVEMLLFYLLLLTCVHLRKNKLAKYFLVGLCFCFILDLAFWNLKDSFQKDLRLTFVDVGQGDSILIEFPKGKKMLVDGGGLYDDRFDIGKNVIAPVLWKKKIRRIDILVLTHPDPDHLKGLTFIASHFSIGQFWESGIQTDSPSYLQLKKILREKKVAIYSLRDKVPFQNIHGVEISILSPPEYFFTKKEGRFSPDTNNSSLVMMLRFKNIAILLPGDIEEEAEEQLVRKTTSLKADILKIPHHGSLSSSTLPFLKRVAPSWAILSVSERNIGRLPHPEVIQRYRQIGAKILRTDRQGAVTMETDGHKIDWSCVSGNAL